MSTDNPQFAIVASALSDDLRQAAHLARGAGFAGVLFDAYSPALAIPDLSTSGRRDFRHMLAAQEQQLVAIRVDIGPHGLALGADADRVLARLDRVMESTAALSCRLLCVDLGPLPEPQQTASPKPTVTPAQAGLIILPESLIAPQSAPSAPFDATAAAQVDAALFDLGRRADRHGVTFAFRTDLASFAALERALKAADCPWFAVDLDPVAILRDEWDMDDVFSRLGPLIRHIRARDAIRGNDRRTRPAIIGQGSTNWAELLGSLDQGAYRGWITIDPLELANRTAAAAAAALEHLRGIR